MPDELAGPASAPSPAAPDPAPPASPAPVSAERAAADTGDFGAFDRAAVARKQGKALPDVTPTSAAGAAEGTDPESPDEPMPGRPLSRRQREIIHYKQQLAIQDQRIRDLERRTGRPSEADPAGSRPPSNGDGPPPAPETAKQRAARYLARPDAPKVDDFDTYPEYTAAQTLYLQDTVQAEAAAVQAQHQAQQAQHERLITRDQTFRERLTAAKDADPAFVPGLSEEAKNLGGLEHAKRQGVAAGPTHIIGELLYDSPQAVPFLRAISADPTLLASLVAPPAALQQLPPQWRVKAHIDHLVTEFRRLEGRLAYETERAAADTAPHDDAPPSSVSSAPPPPPTLTKAGRSADPVRSAVDRGDFAAYDAAEMARKIRQRTAGRGGR